jgi:MYXO-CTERM domain-containing protein
MSTKTLIAAAGLLATSGAVLAAGMGRTADSISPANLDARGTTNSIVNIDVTGVQSFDGLGGGNTVLEIDLADALGLAAGSQVTMTAVGWDVTISTFGASWLSEATIYFDDNVAPDESGLFLAPGTGLDAPGSQAFSSGGLLDLSDSMIPNIVLPNGILRLEFFEGFDDVLGEADAEWSGTISIGVTEVPAPGAAAALGLAGLAGMRRRR